MRAPILVISFLSICFSCSSQPQLQSDPDQMLMGAYQTNSYLSLIKDRRIALVVNQTSVINGTHLVDSLLARDVKIKKVFAPEHGFRGQADAGEQLKDGVDTKTGLSIISLYGSNKKPTKDQLADIDVVIFDIQDVGTRFYTYISTMHYVMEACAEQGKKVLILDRPNPNGMFIDGPILDPEFKSFVGMHPIPLLHGLTVGELALMINGEGWLSGGIKCDIEVIPVKNYSHSMNYSLPVKPSPNLPNDLSIQLYPSLCLFEGTVISVGRGTYKPFQQIGHPSFKDMAYSFTPVSIEGMSKYPKYQDEICHGVAFNNDNAIKGLDLSYLIEFYNRYEDKNNFFVKYFNTLAGTDQLQKQIQSGMTEEEIKATWKGALDEFKVLRKKYLLYPDF